MAYVSKTHLSPTGFILKHQFSILFDGLFDAKWFQGDLIIITGDVCIPSQPPPHLVHVWVPVLIVCCLGSCAVHPGEECWLGQVHGRRADPKHLSNPLLNPLPHIPAENTHSTQSSVSDTSPAACVLQLLLLPQLRNHGEHTLTSYLATSNNLFIRGGKKEKEKAPN